MEGGGKRQRNELEKAEELCVASEDGDLETVKRLIEVEGVDVNAKNRNDLTAFYYACRGTWTDVILYMLSNPNLDLYQHHNIRHLSPVEWLVRNGNLVVLRILVQDSRFQINKREDITGFHLVDRACHHAWWELAKLLLDQPKLDLFRPSDLFSLAVDRAFDGERLDILKCLFEKWAPKPGRWLIQWRLCYWTSHHVFRMWPRYRPRWTKQNHHKWPERLRTQIFAWLLCCHRQRLVPRDLRLLMCEYICEAWKDWKVGEIDRELNQ